MLIFIIFMPWPLRCHYCHYCHHFRRRFTMMLQVDGADTLILRRRRAC